MPLLPRWHLAVTKGIIIHIPNMNVDLKANVTRFYRWLVFCLIIWVFCSYMVYKGCPESIQPFWIYWEMVGLPWCNLAASQRRPYWASVNSHSPVGLVSWQWDAVDWDCVLCDRRIHKSPPFQGLPSSIMTTQPVLEIFKMAGYFPDRPRTINTNVENKLKESKTLVFTKASNSQTACKIILKSLMTAVKVIMHIKLQILKEESQCV